MRSKLVSARKAAGKLQQQIADEVGISRAYYTNVETGDRTPSLNVAVKIAEAVGCPGDMSIFMPDDVPNSNITSAAASE